MQPTNLYMMTIGLTTKHGKLLDKQAVLDMVASELPAFSATEQTGYWEGAAERSLAISLVDTTGQAEEQLRKLAAKLAWVFEQACVLLTKQPVAYQFVEPSL